MRRLASVLIPLLFAAALFFPGIDWGLPSRETDKYLFATSQPWTGAEILSLLDSGESGVGSVESPDRSSSSPLQSPHSPLGADVDATPILNRSKPIVLNDTDAKRAAIVQRYRLMSGQPDEFIQFKALAEMATRPGIHKLDPRLYQYGGLWIYPVGGLLYTCDKVGLVELKSDRAYYLDHPEQFGKFYVVARCYSAMWGLVAIACVGWITNRVTRNRAVAALAACAFALLPVVTTAAQEAKPHLAGCALVLLTVITATRFVETGKRRWMLLASVLAGAAPAMVLSMVWAVAVLPVMVVLRGTGLRHVQRDVHVPEARATPVQRLAVISVCAATAFATYAVTNPFVLYNALFAREAIASNLGNSTAMYGIRDLPRAVVDATRIFTLGATPVVMIGAVVGGVALLRSAMKRRREGEAPAEPMRMHDSDASNRASAGSAGASPSQHALPSDDASPRRTALLLLAAPTVFALLTFIALAAGKPAEYARFSLLVAAMAVVVMAGGLHRISRAGYETAVFFAAVAAVSLQLFSTLAFYVADMKGNKTRAYLKMLHAETQMTPEVVLIGTYYEPAPWSLLPIDLWRDPILLLDPAIEPLDQPVDLALHPRQLSSQIPPRFSQREPLSWRTQFTEAIPTAQYREALHRSSTQPTTQP